MCLTRNLEKLDSLLKNFDCSHSEDGIDFSFTVSLEKLRLLKEFNDAGLPDLSFDTGEQWVDLGDLSSRIGKEVKAELLFQELKAAGLNVYQDWSHFFSYKPHLISVPDSFLILSDHTIHPNEPTSKQVKHYFDVCKIVQLLISRADYIKKITDEIVEEVIFLHKEKLEIPINYTAEVLEEGLDGISIVNALFEDNSHIEQKISIFKEVISSFLSNISKTERLQYLLCHFGEFSKRLNENYQLFVSEFSFDDVRKEYEESKREYFTKLNDVFSSVQTKMLGVPISIAFASFKMNSFVTSASFLTDSLLGLSIVIYSIMMILMIANQNHSLKAVKTDYESQMARLKHHYSDQYKLSEDILIDLNKRS